MAGCIWLTSQLLAGGALPRARREAPAGQPLVRIEEGLLPHQLHACTARLWGIAASLLLLRAARLGVLPGSMSGQRWACARLLALPRKPVKYSLPGPGHLAIMASTV